MNTSITDFYCIRPLTNLHVGSGDTNYEIVDNIVQRDPSNSVPVIHSSSLKGAIRQYYRESTGGSDQASKNEVAIFGSDTSPRNKNQTDFSAGSHLFLEARLLVLPVRSDKFQFFRAVCPELVKDMLKSWEYFGFQSDGDLKEAFEYVAGIRVSDTPKVLLAEGELRDFSIENWYFADTVKAVDSEEQQKLAKAEAVFGKNLVVVDIDSFKALCKKLPVIARNQLENGISQNLFYEEVVPRESRFYTFIMSPQENNWMDAKTRLLDLQNKRVQIGANATIGYGQCLFERYASKPVSSNSKN